MITRVFFLRLIKTRDCKCIECLLIIVLYIGFFIRDDYSGLRVFDKRIFKKSYLKWSRFYTNFPLKEFWVLGKNSHTFIFIGKICYVTVNDSTV